jgi:hypothetical protein
LMTTPIFAKRIRYYIHEHESFREAPPRYVHDLSLFMEYNTHIRRDNTLPKS